MSEEVLNARDLFNSGVSSFQRGDYAEALAAFLAARPLLPRSEELKQNILLTQEKLNQTPGVPSAWPMQPSWQAPFTPFSNAELRAAGSLVWFAAIVIFITQLFWRKSSWAFLGSLILLLSIGAGISIFAADQREDGLRWSVVCADRIKAYAEPSTKSPLARELVRGQMVAIRRGGEGWVLAHIVQDVNAVGSAWIEGHQLCLYH